MPIVFAGLGAKYCDPFPRCSFPPACGAHAGSFADPDISPLALVVSELIFAKMGFGLLSIIGFPLEVQLALRSFFGAIATSFTIITLAGLALFKVLAAVLPVAKAVAEFVKDPKSAAQTASMNDVSKQLGQLIRQALPEGSKFVVFIDDLERAPVLRRPVDVWQSSTSCLTTSGWWWLFRVHVGHRRLCGDKV